MNLSTPQPTPVYQAHYYQHYEDWHNPDGSPRDPYASTKNLEERLEKEKKEEKAAKKARKKADREELKRLRKEVKELRREKGN